MFLHFSVITNIAVVERNENNRYNYIVSIIVCTIVSELTTSGHIFYILQYAEHIFLDGLGSSKPSHRFVVGKDNVALILPMKLGRR